MNRYIRPTLMCLRPRRHIITTKSLRILHDMSLTALRNDYDPKTAFARIRTGDLKVEENPDRSFDTSVTARCKRHTRDVRLGIVYLYESLHSPAPPVSAPQRKQCLEVWYSDTHTICLSIAPHPPAPACTWAKRGRFLMLYSAQRLP